MKKKHIYSNYTYNSKNLLARFSHRARFFKGIKIALEKEFNSILDYGAGDNKFLNELILVKNNAQLFAFEPVMDIKANDKIKIYTDLEDFKNQKFDVITCFETLEHFNESAQRKMLQTFEERLEDGGRIIISVPIEIGLPSLIKNIRRMTFEKINYKDIKNTLKCLFGREVPEIRNMDGFIFPHIGFNHNKLERLIFDYFIILKKEASPFKNLSEQFNSQMFYILTRKGNFSLK